ncbi:MAG: hypothetical protein LBI03_08155 [Clostridiales bacterium]|jgi:hypothetical protein|nr:hypothetical protein [Clostridiales bacterium]
MNYSTSSTNAVFPYSTGTAVPGVPVYFLKGISYVPQGNIIYRLNMPFEPNSEKLPTVIINNTQHEDEEFSSYLNDALKRYKEINNGAVFEVAKADSFLRVLKNVCNTLQLQPYIIFNKFATKVQFSFNGKDFVLDYDHEDQNTVFILSSKDETLIVKESILDKLEETIRSF